MTKEQKEEYAKLHGEAGELITKVATEKREQTPEEKEAQTKRYARMDTLKAQAEAEKRHAQYAFETGTTQNEPNPAAREEFHRQGGEAGGGRPPSAPGTTEYAKEYRAALNQFLRTGEGNQRFAITTGTSVLVPKSVLPPETVRRNNNAFRAALAATGYEPIETSNTDQLSLPVFDDTANTGDQPAENATADVTVDFATGGSITLNATLYSSKTRWFSNTLLNANGFDILAYVTPIIQKSVDKAQEVQWTANLKAVTPAGSVTTASKNAVTYQNIVAWEHSLPVAYRSDACFIFADTLYQAVRGLVDNNNRPIMDLDPTNVFQAKLHNKPVLVSDYLDPIGTASGTPGAFLSGDAIKMRDVVPQRLTRYVNVPQYRDQTGYDLFANGDCQFVASGVALLKLFTS